MKKTVLITGASSGIGSSCANDFAEAGYRVIITGRRQQRLEQLKETLVKQHTAEVHVLVMDVRNPQQVKQAIDSLIAPWNEIDILINNAGLALGLDTIDQGNPDDWEQMIDTNIKGLLYMTRYISPGMISRKKGHIINVGSVAGREVYAKGNVYCATKHAVDALNQGMRIDMLAHGIKVSQVSPGATQTEFSKVRFHGDEKKADDVYKGFKPLSAQDVSKVILFVASLPEHVNINDLLLMPTAQAAAGIIHKI